MATPTDMDTITATAEPFPLLRLLQLASPALPVGAFNFSQGLEYAVEQEWVRDAASAGEWILGIGAHGIARVDLPLLLRLHAAWSAGDAARALQLSRELVATRETREARAEERHMGQALAKILVEFGIDAARDWQREPSASHAALFALAASHAGAPARDTALAYLWTWAENQVLAAVKLIPLGQTDGQRMLEKIRQRIPRLVALAEALGDEEIGSAAPLAIMAGAWHETQYTRLFRS
ncbi:MAG TPA: urease accessory protein UreF [Steroidobacteraceae bacterium]|nr:urease accessory protein UreF [Steroidobacteraceae bacterium]